MPFFRETPSDAEFFKVRDAYREPHRRYHNFEHLREVLEALKGLGNEDPVVWLSAFYHDAVYDPQSPTNEEDSVTFLRDALHRLGIAPLPEAEAIILATKTHRAETPGQAMLLDADLAILGAERPRYEAYARAIREEYAHVPDSAYRSGRAAILRGFLDRERIYHSPKMAAYEARARENLEWEIRTLN